MRMLVVVLLLSVLVSPFVSSLKCYKCESSLSYEDCARKGKEEACDETKGEDRCVKEDVSYTLHSTEYHLFGKSCVKHRNCSKKDNDHCKKAELGTGLSCWVSCCSSDMCNAGSSPMVSSIVIVTCVVGLLVNIFGFL